jgi:hypothetical protein
MVAAAKPEARLPCGTGAQHFQFLPLLGILLLQSADARNKTFSIIVEEILDYMYAMSLSREPRKRRPTRCRFPRRVDSAGPVSPTCT